MYRCEKCHLEMEIKQKYIHIRRKHTDESDDLAKYYNYARQCTKLYSDVIKKINEIEVIEENIMKFNPKQNLENKSWYSDYINNRNTFLELISNIVTK